MVDCGLSLLPSSSKHFPPGRQDPLIVRIEPLDGKRAHAAAEELVDRGMEQLLVARELLRRVRTAARVDDGGDVVLAHVLIEELLGRFLHLRVRIEADVRVIKAVTYSLPANGWQFECVSERSARAANA